jgi:2-polyprenyl-3-methyl-5-hydroxy-6-metoxy-1,4-benzoquinol methylase
MSLERVMAGTDPDESHVMDFSPTKSQLGPLSQVARRGKVNFFLPKVSQDARILDLGCADNWFKKVAAERGWDNVVGMDLFAPADIIGDVRNWRDIGVPEHSFDIVVAFEVLEHGDYAESVWHMLKPDGLLFATTPVPRMDPVCKMMEALHLLQRRTSPHSHLIDLRELEYFEVIERHIKAGVSQWAILRPQASPVDDQ